MVERQYAGSPGRDGMFEVRITSKVSKHHKGTGLEAYSFDTRADGARISLLEDEWPNHCIVVLGPVPEIVLK